MNYIEKLKDLIEKSGGIILTKQLAEAGIPRTYITELMRDGTLERVDYGAYISRDSFDDKMYRLQVKYKEIVFSHDTALYLHDLSDRDPLVYTVTVPAGYNYRNLKTAGIQVFSIKKELYELGLATAKTIYGRQVRCYNMERTICDILRSRNQMEIGILTDGLKRYSKRRDKNLPQLMRYAEKFGITNIVTTHMQVIL